MKENPNYGGCETNRAQPEGIDGDYLTLEHGAVDNQRFLHRPDDPAPVLANNNGTRTSSRSIWWWLYVVAIFALVAVLGVVIIKRFGPLFVKKEVIPIIKWLINTFSPPVLAAILFAAIALFPVLLLPTTPFKWVAGMSFGYGLGFLLIMAGVAVAVSLPYFIGYHLFLHKIKRWLDKHPNEAAIVRLAGDGDWFHQFRAIVLIRLAPFPYVVFNYTAVATGVKYSPYLAGSLLGMVPEVLVAIYSGILIRRVAEAMDGGMPVSKFQSILDGVGLCLTLVATIIIGFYAKAKLKQLQVKEELPQLQQQQ